MTSGGTGALGISADGTVVVGEAWFTGLGNRAFRWTAASGFIPLGALGLPGESSRAIASSGDGSVIVGTASGFTIGPTQAIGPIPFIWDEQSGMRRLDLVLAQSGAAPTVTLEEIVGISDDGLVMVGTTGSSGSASLAWVAALPVPEPTAFIAQVTALTALLAIRRTASRD